MVSIVHGSRTKTWATEIARHWILHRRWLLHHHGRRILHLKTHHFSLIDCWSCWRRLLLLPWPSSRSFLAIRIVIHLSLQLLSLSLESLLFLSLLILFLLFDLLGPHIQIITFLVLPCRIIAKVESTTAWKLLFLNFAGLSVILSILRRWLHVYLVLSQLNGLILSNFEFGLETLELCRWLRTWLESSITACDRNWWCLPLQLR